MKSILLKTILTLSLFSTFTHAEEGENFDWSAWEEGNEIVFTQTKKYEVQDKADHPYFTRNVSTIEERRIGAGTRGTLHSIGCASKGTKPFTALATLVSGANCVAVIKLADGEFVNITDSNVYGKSMRNFIENTISSQFYTNKPEKKLPPTVIDLSRFSLASRMVITDKRTFIPKTNASQK